MSITKLVVILSWLSIFVISWLFVLKIISRTDSLAWVFVIIWCILAFFAGAMLTQSEK